MVGLEGDRLPVGGNGRVKLPLENSAYPRLL